MLAAIAKWVFRVVFAAILGAPGLWLLNSIAPWELHEVEGTVAEASAFPYYNSDDSTDDAIGVAIDFTTAEHACLFFYSLRSGRLGDAKAALASGDRVAFRTRRSDLRYSESWAGYNCLETEREAIAGRREARLDVSDVVKDGELVMHATSSRLDRGLGGTILLALGALVLGWPLLRRRGRGR